MKVKSKAGDDAVTASMIENQKNGLAEAVTNLRKSVNEELEELRRSRAAHTNNRFLNFEKTESKKNLLDSDYDYIHKEGYRAKLKKLGSKSPTAKIANQVVFNINDFYREQRKKAKFERKKKDETFKEMNTFRESFSNHSIVSARLSDAKKYEEEVTQKNELAKIEKLKSMTKFFVNSSYKAFVFATHPNYGMILLFCTKKKIKGDHFQLPGGSINESEFKNASARSGGDPRRQLILSSKKAVARQLWEEVGIDIRENLKRLKPAHIRFDSECYNELSCEHRRRLFFTLEVDDSDFYTPADIAFNENLVFSINGQDIPLMLKLSKSHSGFKFQMDLNEAVHEIKKHSGKACSEALQLKIKKTTTEKPNRRKINRIIEHIEDDIKSIESSKDETSKSKPRPSKKKTGKIASIIKDIEDRSTNGSVVSIDDMSSHASGSISGTSWDSNSSDDSDTRQNLIGLTLPLNILPQEEDLDDELDDDFAFDLTHATLPSNGESQGMEEAETLSPQLNGKAAPKICENTITTQPGTPTSQSVITENIATPVISNSTIEQPTNILPKKNSLPEIMIPNDSLSRNSVDSFGRSTTSSQRRIIFPHLYRNKTNSESENKIGLEVMFEVSTNIEDETGTNLEIPNNVESEDIYREIQEGRPSIETEINELEEESNVSEETANLYDTQGNQDEENTPAQRSFEDDSTYSYKDFYSDEEEIFNTPTQQSNPFQDLSCIFCFQLPGQKEKKKS